MIRVELQFLFRDEELSILERVTPPELDEQLSVLECDLRILKDSTDVLGHFSKSFKLRELETGKILGIVWVESLETILRAVSEIAQGKTEAEAYLMASEFWFKLVGEHGTLKMFLRAGDEVDRLIAETARVSLASDLFRSCQHSAVILLARFPSLRRSRVYAQLQSKLEGVGLLLNVRQKNG